MIRKPFSRALMAIAVICLLVTTAQAKIEALSSKQAGIVTIAAFTARGDLAKLGVALNEGLDAGLTINEIKEVLVQMYAYTGFPRSLNAINTFADVLKERERRGKRDRVGAEASPLPANRSSLELGSEIRTALTGNAPVAEYARFVPVIDQFLLAHLFGDIFGRDNLDYQSREIATLSALATLERVDPQLRSHFNVGLNVGLSDAQLREVIAVVGTRVDKEQAANAARVLNAVLSGRSERGASSSTAANSASTPSPTIRLTRSGETKSEPAPADNFTGSATVQRLFSAY